MYKRQLLWVLLGGIFFGAVTDFGALYASVKNDGKSIGLLIEKYIGKLGRKLFLLFCWLFTLLVIAAFADMVAGTFNAFTTVDGQVQLSEAARPNGAAGTISLLFILFAMVFGVLQKKFNLSGWKATVVGLVCTIAALAIGMALPITAGKDTWTYITFVYIFFAAVLPIWLLKQPRDMMTTYMFIGMIVGAVLGLLVAHPTMNLPVYTGFTNEKLGNMFPILFVTVACGITSGFHSTQCTLIGRSVTSEKEGRFTFYWMMILEGLIAMIWAAAAMGIYNKGSLSGATGVVGEVAKDLLGPVGGLIAILGVIVLPITSGDTALRSCRLMVADYLHIDQKEKRNRIMVTLGIFIPVIAILVFAKLNAEGFNILWRYFAWANQTIAVFAFAAITVYLCAKKGAPKYAFLISLLPGTFYIFIISSFLLSQSIGFGLPLNVSYLIAGVIALVYLILVPRAGKKFSKSHTEE